MISINYILGSASTILFVEVVTHGKMLEICITLLWCAPEIGHVLYSLYCTHELHTVCTLVWCAPEIGHVLYSLYCTHELHTVCTLERSHNLVPDVAFIKLIMHRVQKTVHIFYHILPLMITQELSKFCL